MSLHIHIHSLAELTSLCVFLMEVKRNSRVKIQSYSVFFYSLLWTEVIDNAFNDADMPVGSLNVITLRIKALMKRLQVYVTHDLRIMSRWP